MKLKNKITFSHIITFLCIAYLLVPLTTGMVSQGEDLWYHLLRIESIKTSILDGQFPVRISSLFMNGYGYATSLCYPEFFLYIPAFFRILGLGIADSLNLFLALTVVGCYASAYFCAKGITKDKRTALLAAVIFSMSQYHLANLFVRGSVGEAQAFVFFPMILYGLYDLIWEDFKKPFVFGLGFWGLMMCHTISLVIALLVTLTLCLIYVRRILFDKKKMLRLLGTAGMVLLTSAMFWAPMLEQLFSVELQFGFPWTTVSETAVQLNQIFSVGNDTTTMNFDFVILLLCLVGLTVEKNQENEGMFKKGKWFLLFGLLTLFTCTRLFPWKLLQPVLNNLQFPWRFYAIASLFLSVAAAIFLMLKTKGRYYKETAVVVLALMFLGDFLYFNNHTPNYRVMEEDYYEQTYTTFDIGAKEWLPAVVAEDVSPMEVREVKDQDGNVLAHEELRGMSLSFVRTGTEEWCDVPFIWYKGYSAVLKTNEQEEILLTVSQDAQNNGMVKVDFGDNRQEGTVTVSYTGTWIQKVSLVVSWAGILVTGIWMWRKYKGSKGRKRNE